MTISLLEKSSILLFKQVSNAPFGVNRCLRGQSISASSTFFFMEIKRSVQNSVYSSLHSYVISRTSGVPSALERRLLCPGLRSTPKLRVELALVFDIQRHRNLVLTYNDTEIGMWACYCYHNH